MKMPLIAMLVLSLSSLAVAQATKIATVNPARVFNEMQETKDLQQKMEAERRNLANTEREKKDHIKSLQDAREQLKPGTPQHQDKNRELLQAAIEFKAWGEMMQAEVARIQKQQMKGLFDRIEAAVAEVAAQRGIDLVLADHRTEITNEMLDNPQFNVQQLRELINQRDVLHTGKNVDISSDVIAALDAKYKGAKK